VTREEGLALAQEYGCLFLESSAKTRENVEKCFEELALKVYLHKPKRYLIPKAYLFALIPFKIDLLIIQVNNAFLRFMNQLCALVKRQSQFLSYSDH
jgi:GTPase SAR1 family protein